MSCYLTRSESGGLLAVLTFKRELLLYDISNAAYVEGSVLSPEVPVHNRHLVQDATEEGNVDRISRVLDLCIAQCREMLYAFTKNKVTEAELNNELKEPSVYGIVLNVPEDFSQTTLQLLKELIHEYLVCSAVAEWMSITNTGKFEIWKAKANEMEMRLQVALNSRVNKNRRRMHPFA